MIPALLLLLAQDEPPFPGRGPKILAEFSLLFERTQAAPGQTLWAALVIDVPEGYHVYPGQEQEKPTFPTKIEPEAQPHLTFGEPRWPEAHAGTTGAFVGVLYHEGKVAVGIPVTVASGAPAGEVEVGLKVSYMLCDDEKCLLPQQGVPVTATLKIDPGPSEAAHEETFAAIRAYAAPLAMTSAEAAARAEYEKRGFGGMLLLGAVGGLISLVMPCVWPLIPMTLMYFVKQGGDSRGRTLLLCAMYALGIVVSFTGLGLLLTVQLGADGARAFAAYPSVNLIAGAIFMLFGISMFGAFDLALPGWVTSRLTGGGPKAGVGGALLLGLLFSVVTFTCTIPIAATILALAVSTEHRTTAVLSMLVYSATMAAPFLLGGLFPTALKKIPKSGGWMTTVKVTVAFLEVGLALIYFGKADATSGYGILSRSAMLAIWVVVLAAAALFLFGGWGWLVKSWKPDRLGAARLTWGALFLAGAVMVGMMAVGRAIPRPVFAVMNIFVIPHIDPNVFHTLPEAQAAARKEGKLIFLEFTGVT